MTLSNWASCLLITTPVAQMRFWNTSRCWVCQKLDGKLGNKATSSCNPRKSTWTFATARHLTSASETIQPYQGISLLLDAVQIVPQKQQGAGLHFFLKEHREVLCFPPWAGKFQGAEPAQCVGLPCVLKVKFPVGLLCLRVHWECCSLWPSLLVTSIYRREKIGLFWFLWQV